MFFWGNTQLVVEGVMPDLLHVLPVGDDAAFNWKLHAHTCSYMLSERPLYKLVCSTSSHTHCISLYMGALAREITIHVHTRMY